MRRLGTLVLVVSLTLALAASAQAQQPPRPGGGLGAGLGALLQNKAIQEEVKLTEEQVKKAGEALKKVSEDNKELLEKLRDRNLPMEERAEILKKMTAASTAALKDAIEPEQLARLKQIQLQVQMQFTGLAVFADTEIQKALKLTDEQKKDLATLAEEVAKEVKALFQGGFNADTFKNLQALQKEGMEKASKMLTADQKKAWDELVGKAFDMSKLIPMRPMQ